MLLLTIGILDKFPRGLLYGSFSYESLGFSTSHGMLLRLLLISVSFCWIAILLAFSLNIRIPQIEFVGQHTLVIYLTHGIIVMIAKKYNLLKIDGFFSLTVIFVVCLILTYGVSGPQRNNKK